MVELVVLVHADVLGPAPRQVEPRPVEGTEVHGLGRAALARRGGSWAGPAPQGDRFARAMPRATGPVPARGTMRPPTTADRVRAEQLDAAGDVVRRPRTTGRRGGRGSSARDTARISLRPALWQPTGVVDERGCGGRPAGVRQHDLPGAVGGAAVGHDDVEVPPGLAGGCASRHSSMARRLVERRDGDRDHRLGERGGQHAHRPLPSLPRTLRIVRPMMRTSVRRLWWRRYQNSYWSFSRASLSLPA